MPHIENVYELVEWLADQIGVYGCHDERCAPGRECRTCWTSGLDDRIRNAVENEKRLAALGEDHPDGAIAMRADERNGGVKRTKRQREVLRHFADGRPIGPWPLEWAPYYMVKRLIAAGLLEDSPSFAPGHWKYRITEAGCRALAERGDGTEELHA